MSEKHSGIRSYICATQCIKTRPLSRWFLNTRYLMMAHAASKSNFTRTWPNFTIHQFYKRMLATRQWNSRKYRQTCAEVLSGCFDGEKRDRKKKKTSKGVNIVGDSYHPLENHPPPPRSIPTTSLFRGKGSGTLGHDLLLDGL